MVSLKQIWTPTQGENSEKKSIKDLMDGNIHFCKSVSVVEVDGRKVGTFEFEDGEKYSTSSASIIKTLESDYVEALQIVAKKWGFIFEEHSSSQGRNFFVAQPHAKGIATPSDLCGEKLEVDYAKEIKTHSNSYVAFRGVASDIGFNCLTSATQIKDALLSAEVQNLLEAGEVIECEITEKTSKEGRRYYVIN